jgi:signal transduction histidine kinase
VAIDNSRLHQQAQEAVRARDQFLSIASHELRTPLTPLKLQLQSLEKQISCLERGEVALKGLGQRIAIIRRQSDRLEKLVGELLDVSRITARRLPFTLEDIDLVQVVREVEARLEETGEVTRSNCTVVLHAPARAVGHWDRFRLDQVVTNLLENALKFGAGGSIELSVESDAVEATLTVTDHGIGIAAADRHRIFQRFERAVSEAHYGGLGLGLWIARQVVEGLGGSIELESAPGQGATFRVRLPLAGPLPTYAAPVQEQFERGLSA